jgi:hypothetical protein
VSAEAMTSQLKRPGNHITSKDFVTPDDTVQIAKREKKVTNKH